MKQELQVGFTAVQTGTDERFTFAAAASTLGFKIEEGTPTPVVSNVYDKTRKYEPGEPGDVRHFLPLLGNGVNINEFVTTWKDPDEALSLAHDLPALISSADNGQKMQFLMASFDATYLKAAAAYMRLHSLGRVKVPDVYHPNEQEKGAIEALDSFALVFESRDMDTPKGRKKIAAKLAKCWEPAMVAWLKAYRANLLELRNLWKEAPASLRIDRGKGLPPLILEKGPKFREMLNRWT